MMELLERFVCAVERIAGAMESRAVSIAAAAEVIEEHREAMNPLPFPFAPSVDEPTNLSEDMTTLGEFVADKMIAASEEFPVAAGPAANGQELVDREKIKKELDALGVYYAPKARISTLLLLLEDARAKGSSIPDRPEERTFKETITLAQEEARNKIREGLKQVAIRQGRDAAMEILETHGGGAKNVSGVAPEFYGPLLNALGGVA